ncbi:MAG: LexA family protein [Deferrisomatales bacterium]
MTKRESNRSAPPFTPKQAQYLAFLDRYTRQKGYPPAEGDVQAYFGVSAPSVHQMIVTLERKGFVSRVPGQARSVRVLVPREQLPALEATGASLGQGQRRMWVRDTSPEGPPRRRPASTAASSLTASRKGEIQGRADEFVARELRPTAVQPPPTNPEWNYLVDLFTRWHGRYFYFMAKYACPGPHAAAPHFDLAFARLECVGGDQFHVAYSRHTGQWWELRRGATFNECVELIRTEPLLHP